MTRAPVRMRVGATLALAIALGAEPLRAGIAATADDVEAEEIVTAPVVLDGVTFFRVRGLSHLPAEQRAERIADRIEAVAADKSFDPATLRTEEGEAGTEILAGSHRLMVVTDPDAAAEHVPRAVLAATGRESVRQAIYRYRADRSKEVLRQGLLGTLVIGAALAAVLIILILWGRRLAAGLERRLQLQIRSVQIKSFKLIDSEQILRGIHSSLQGFRVLLMVVSCYLAIALALSRFAATRAISDRLLSWLINPLRVIGRSAAAALPNLIFLAVLVLIFRWILRAMRVFFESLEQQKLKLRGFEPELAAPTYRLLRIAVLAFAVVVAYPYVPGSNSEAFKAVSIFAGILFSLGSSSVIASIIAGYAMIYRRTFHVGDRVKIGEVVGFVDQIGLMVTRLRSIKNEESVIPNSEILQSEVVNYSTYAREGRLILHTRVGIGYEVPWRQVEAMLMLAAERTRRIRREPPPFVLQLELKDFCVNYELNVYCDDASAITYVYTELHRNVLDVFNEYGVQIMTPAYEGDPEEPKIVPRARWYEAPAGTAPDGDDAQAHAPAAPAK